MGLRVKMEAVRAARRPQRMSFMVYLSSTVVSVGSVGLMGFGEKTSLHSSLIDSN